VYGVGGWTMTIAGVSSRLAKARNTADRSKRRKSPVVTAIMTIRADANTPQNCENPR
jgi:hypothetical protein